MDFASNEYCIFSSIDLKHNRSISFLIVEYILEQDSILLQTL